MADIIEAAAPHSTYDVSQVYLYRISCNFTITDNA